MASVAADPGAIAPPLPLPSRPDAAPPAGSSNAFADLLDETTPPTASQPHSAQTSAGQSGGPAGCGNASAEPARDGAATAGPRTGKDEGGQETDEQRPALDVTLVAGLSLSPLALAAPPNADQTPAGSQDAQGAPRDPAPGTGGDTTDKPSDRKDAGAPSDPMPAGLVAALPNLIPWTAAPAVARSAPDSTASVRFSRVAALRSEAIFSAPSTSVPAGADASTSGSAQQPDGVAEPSAKAPAATQNVVPAVDSITSAPDVAVLQTATPPPAEQVAADPAASDQPGRSTTAAAPTITPAAPQGRLTPMTALGPINPAPATAQSAEVRAPDQPAGNAGSPREAQDIAIALPAQVAMRFAAPIHADDGNTSDSATDVLFGLAGGDAGGTRAATSGPAGAVIPASFNSSIPMIPASAPAVAPQHLTTPPEMVPLAGIPIAIVARAEAGEKKFEIRLDPPDLGRIEVQLNVDSSGRATSHLIVDRADTLDLLRRDAPALERALQSAGLTTDEGALQFSLRDQSFAGREQWAPATIAAPAAVADSDLAPIDTALRRYGPPMGLGGGIDIRV